MLLKPQQKNKGFTQHLARCEQIKATPSQAIAKFSFRNKRTLSAGFTLMEVLIYIALLILIIGGGMASAYYLITASEKDNAAFITTAEAEFLLRRIDYTLTGVGNGYVSVPTPDRLLVNKDGDIIEISLDTGRAQIKYNSGIATNLTSSRVLIENLSFTHEFTPPAPAKVEVSFTANGKNFSLTKYLRY